MWYVVDELLEVVMETIWVDEVEEVDLDYAMKILDEGFISE